MLTDSLWPIRLSYLTKMNGRKKMCKAGGAIPLKTSSRHHSQAGFYKIREDFGCSTFRNSLFKKSWKPSIIFIHFNIGLLCVAIGWWTVGKLKKHEHFLQGTVRLHFLSACVLLFFLSFPPLISLLAPVFSWEQCWRRHQTANCLASTSQFIRQNTDKNMTNSCVAGLSVCFHSTLLTTYLGYWIFSWDRGPLLSADHWICELTSTWFPPLLLLGCWSSSPEWLIGFFFS